jgi:potassium-transporting ATPase KdpC subunit
MLLNLRRSFIFAVIAVGLTFAYAYLGTGLSQLAFKSKADGSITPSGSTLIGQNWSSPQWFHGRPDDTGPCAADPKRMSRAAITH